MAVLGLDWEVGEEQLLQASCDGGLPEGLNVHSASEE